MVKYTKKTAKDAYTFLKKVLTLLVKMENSMKMKHLQKFSILTAFLLAMVSCGKETPAPTDTFNVSGIYIPTSCVYVEKGGEVVLEVKGGHGPSASDIIVLKGDSELEFPVTSVGENSFSFRIDEQVLSGEYILYVKKDGVLKRVGILKLIITGKADVEADDSTVYGLVSCSGNGIEGVVVSDGVEVTATDENGVYHLKSAKKHGYVFLSVPSGYKPISNGILPMVHAQLTKAASEPERVDFNLMSAQQQENFTMIMLGDIHLANRTNDRIQFRNFVSDINAFTQTLSGPVYGLTLGDMTWDLFWETNSYGYKEYLADAQLIQGLTIYQTIGNHDHSMYQVGDFNTVKEYKKEVAPTYYSFNIGKVHFVVLDDVECTNSVPDKDSRGKDCYVRTYDGNLVQEQFDWLRKDLSYVDPATPLVVSMHIPLYLNDGGYRWYNDKKQSYILQHAQELETILGAFSNVHLFTAHTHTVYNVDKTADKHIFEHNGGAICGTWWWSAYETPGVHIGPDGAPGGYGVVKVDGTDFSWQYKATGSDLDYQFRTYDRNKIHITASKYVPSGNADHKKQLVPGIWGTENVDNEVYINVWDWDPAWKVEVTEEGTPLTVEQVVTYDPLHLIAYTAKRLNKNSDVSDFVTRQTRHMFKVKAASATSTLEIKVTDRFGRVYTETMTRPKEFNTDTYKK